MRVLVADDQAKVRSAVRFVLEQDEDVEVLGEAVDATGLLDWMRVVCPDLILLDWELPGGGGEELLRAIRGNCSRAAIVALSGRHEARRAALAAGVDGFVSKGDPPEALLKTIKACGPHSASPSSKTIESEPGASRSTSTEERRNGHRETAS
jgi:DNA-binding NarL/FixJ family response regulator